MTALPPSGIGALLGLLALTTLLTIGAVIHSLIDRRHTRNRQIARYRRLGAERFAEFERQSVR